MADNTNAGWTAIITDPNAFFRQRAKDPGLLIPLGIVVLVAILASIAALPEAQLNSQVAADTMQSQTQQINQSMAGAISTASNIFSLALSFLGVVIPWVLYAIVFYVLAHFAFDGEGSFSNTLALTGWGFVPAILAQLVNIAAAYYVYGGETLPDGNQAAQNVLNQLQSDPVLLVSGILGIILLLWSGVLWTYAMEHLHDLSRRNAAISVGIPLLVALLLRINGLL